MRRNRWFFSRQSSESVFVSKNDCREDKISDVPEDTDQREISSIYIYIYYTGESCPASFVLIHCV